MSVEKCREILPFGVGHICQPTSSQDKDADAIREMVKDIQDYLMNETNAGIPAIFHEEALTGLTARGATAYPQAIGAACTWNPDLIRTAHWPRIEESCGEDGYLTASIGSAFVEGLQSKGFHDGVAATTKHFLGYGGAVISDYGAVQTGRARDEKSLKRYAVDALMAGNDLEIAWNYSYRFIPEQLQATKSCNCMSHQLQDNPSNLCSSRVSGELACSPERLSQ